MAAAVPFILSAVSTAATVKGVSDARKGRNEQLQQTERLAAEQRANQVQNERAASDVFTRSRARRTPGFSDAGAASLAYTGNAAALGQ